MEKATRTRIERIVAGADEVRRSAGSTVDRHFHSWRIEARSALAAVTGAASSELARFDAIRFLPACPSAGTSAEEYARAFAEGMDAAVVILASARARAGARASVSAPSSNVYWLPRR